jgi:hypothetical protein
MQWIKAMNPGRVAVTLLALMVAFGGVGLAVVNLVGPGSEAGAVGGVDLRKGDDQSEMVSEDDDDDRPRP